MTKYPFLKKIIHSFYSTKPYIFIGKKEINKIGLSYLFFLLCLFWIPEIVKMHFQINNFISNELPVTVKKLPIIQIKNGVASIDKPSPYIITDEETGKEIMIFDVSGKYTSLEGTEAKLLLTETNLIYKQSEMETREYDLSAINDFSLTHERILSWANWGKYLSVLLYLLIIPCAFIYRALQALIYALIGLIFQAILNTKFPFQTIYRLTTLAVTPAFVADKVLGYFDISFTGWSFICLIISLSFLYFGMLSNKQDQNDEELSSSEFGANN